jgi:hypothetical protein
MGVLVLDCRWADIKSHGERKSFLRISPGGVVEDSRAQEKIFGCGLTFAQ